MPSKNILENIHPEVQATAEIIESISPWIQQKDYIGPSWEGIEKFHCQLAGSVDTIAIESAGWYSYDSSTSGGMDGKDWRLIIPSAEKQVVVNCHSLLHDGVWTLTTTTFSTDEVDTDKLEFIKHKDRWKRSMLWTIHLAEKLKLKEEDYATPIADMKRRLGVIDKLHQIKRELAFEIKELYRSLFKMDSNIPEEVSMAINDWDLVENSIGGYRYPTEKTKGGMIVISPSAIDDFEYVTEIIKHELIHAAIIPTDDDGHNDRQFHVLAEAMNLPEEYRD
jgi:hypothetical protein